jgi:hypothetical protein
MLFKRERQVSVKPNTISKIQMLLLGSIAEKLDLWEF